MEQFPRGIFQCLISLSLRLERYCPILLVGFDENTKHVYVHSEQALENASNHNWEYYSKSGTTVSSQLSVV